HLSYVTTLCLSTPPPPPPRSTLFPYTTLFRSTQHQHTRCQHQREHCGKCQATSNRTGKLRPPLSRRCTNSETWLQQVNINAQHQDRKSTRLNSSHVKISYAVFCLKKKKKNTKN